ncbi:major facilitator superfamily domain-containing protein 6-like [Dendronephthya gigantea]|uniref:major facilitator superfamily domain-containing protein 6-like n=1 Tax=Dendronephthya gigantea TaxID=151771 RepID=UPI00106CC746|nr:major facilitator superfamily domain-containing protein 6-like [Dendronephthya gigantea]
MQSRTLPTTDTQSPEGSEDPQQRNKEEQENSTNEEGEDESLLPDRTLLTYKAFYFLFFAGFGSTFPYLTIYFKQMGLTASYVGTLSGIRPLVQFVSGPFWAYLADKYQSRKLVLSMSVVAWLIFTLALAFPQPKKTKCEQFNSTNHVQIRDVHRSVSYSGLPLAPIPVTEGLFAKKKSTIGLAVKKEEEQTKIIVYDKNELRTLFYIFLILIVVGEIFEAPSFIMIDTALIQKLGDKCHDYGKTRCFGSMGYGLASFGVGAVLDTTRYIYCGREMNDYMVIFYFFVAFMIIGLIFVLALITFKYNENSTSCDSSIFKVYKLCFSAKYATFLLTVWFMGIGNGGQVTFINWYLEDLGASKFMMGLATTIRSMAVIVGFFLSGVLINRLGELPSVFWSLVAFAVIFFGYSNLVNPWLVIPLEILQGFVYALSWATCIVYLSAVTPDDGAATMQSILQGIYWGLGTGIGAILGGVLINQYGIISAYRIGGTATIVVTFFFVISQWLISKYNTVPSREDKVNLSDNPESSETKNTETKGP